MMTTTTTTSLPIGQIPTKTCSICKVSKTLDLFYRCNKVKSGLKSECKECCLKRNRAYALKHPDKVKVNKRKCWYKSWYGVSVELVDKMIEDQDGRCAICNLKVPLEYDHCHETETSRGMLCTKCNKAIGLLMDSSYNARKAADYLDKYSISIL